MSISTESSVAPLQPVVRFRIRTVLIVTTVLAVAAAVAAPYWHRQPSGAKVALAAYWGGFMLCGLAAGWFHWRLAWRHFPESGPIAHIAWLGRRTRLTFIHSPIGMIVMAIVIVAILAGQTYVIAGQGARVKSGSAMFALIHGFCFGMSVGGFLLFFLRRPAYLCETGLAGGAYAPWKYIRHAEWATDEENLMKLRRIDGDIYLDVPARERDAVEAFVRTKTKFIDAAPTSELQPNSSPPVLQTRG